MARRRVETLVGKGHGTLETSLWGRSLTIWTELDLHARSRIILLSPRRGSPRMNTVSFVIVESLLFPIRPNHRSGTRVTPDDRFRRLIEKLLAQTEVIVQRQERYALQTHC